MTIYLQLGKEALFAVYLTFPLQVCQHPHLGMRNWGAEAVTSLIKAALRHPFDPPLHQQQVVLHIL